MYGNLHDIFSLHRGRFIKEAGGVSVYFPIQELEVAHTNLEHNVAYFDIIQLIKCAQRKLTLIPIKCILCGTVDN